MIENEKITSFLPDLKRYCISIARTPWDGEDLYQNTMLKMIKYQSSIQNHPNPKAYLFKIATNQWRDMLKKNKYWRNMNSFDEDTSLLEIATVDSSMIEFIEILVAYLPFKQASTILLIDYYDFTAKEVSEMLETTIGAVKSTLHRGRKSIQNLRNNTCKKEKTHSLNVLINRLLNAIERNDVKTVISTYHLLITRGIKVNKDDEWFYFEFQDLDGNLMSMKEKINK
ncbi:RNA polymerase sigma factor [Chengkuizengella marina]|uniref:RNA polymerase sigma factor n=1 Tax=Chengkuizengella marina TaxID=2507566 RepID=A0A6N9Q7C2_9BACL|nr:RNA polymerase sigma factor [Chengkuizengella marina]NBI30534.1 RNA polymerase sigma factor [Chengkuizengella marina]